MKPAFAALFLSASLTSLAFAQTSPHAPHGHGHPATPTSTEVAAQPVAKSDGLVPLTPLTPLTPPVAPAAPAPHAQPQLPNVGTVVSATDAGGYTYIELAGTDGNTWLAAPAVKVKAGDTVRYENGAMMRNFSSRSLGRTFPAISFIGRVAVESK